MIAMKYGQINESVQLANGLQTYTREKNNWLLLRGELRDRKGTY